MIHYWIIMLQIRIDILVVTVYCFSKGSRSLQKVAARMEPAGDNSGGQRQKHRTLLREFGQQSRAQSKSNRGARVIGSDWIYSNSTVYSVVCAGCQCICVLHLLVHFPFLSYPSLPFRSVAFGRSGSVRSRSLRFWSGPVRSGRVIGSHVRSVHVQMHVRNPSLFS